MTGQPKELCGTSTAPLEPVNVPAFIGGLAHGRPLEWPDPWPVRYAEPDDHDYTYVVFYVWDDARWRYLRFFAPKDSSERMREGWLRSWLRDHSEWTP